MLHMVTLVTSVALLPLVHSIELDLTSPTSIKSAAKIVADSLINLYNGTQPGQIPGIFGSPYYWWESGAVWDGMINYWALTGDDEYNDIVGHALEFQVGSNKNFEPANQTVSEGNDDQAIWALAAMSAVEYDFPAPSVSSGVTWLGLAETVFNEQVRRWDTGTCTGGLRWQIFAFNAGYDYKNSMSNGALFQLAARLARATGNQTYVDWAEKVWDWSSGVGLVSDVFDVFDGTATTANCTAVNHLQWTANAGLFLYGSAVIWNITSGSSQWQTRTEGLLNATNVFFNESVMVEVECETTGLCNTDQKAFKALLSRWLGQTIMVAPTTSDFIMQKLKASAQGAAAACDGGADGTTCGEKWNIGNFDGDPGVGEQLCALDVIQANLIGHGAASSLGAAGNAIPSTAAGPPSGSNNTAAGASPGTSTTPPSGSTSIIAPSTGTASTSATASATVTPYTGSAVRNTCSIVSMVMVATAAMFLA